jgi:hypothetical protein
MIYAAVSHISSQLNQFMRRSFDLAEDVVVMSNILEQDGTLAPNINNKLVVSLVNVTKETTPVRSPQAGNLTKIATAPPPLFMNLYVMIAAHFSAGNYAESLKFLSNTVSFFQRQPMFDHQSTPDLDRRIDKLVLDIENLDTQDLSSLWGILSGKYLPSVLYRVRMVCFDTNDIVNLDSPITGSQVSVM